MAEAIGRPAFRQFVAGFGRPIGRLIKNAIDTIQRVALGAALEELRSRLHRANLLRHGRCDPLIEAYAILLRQSRRRRLGGRWQLERVSPLLWSKHTCGASNTSEVDLSIPQRLVRAVTASPIEEPSSSSSDIAVLWIGERL